MNRFLPGVLAIPAAVIALGACDGSQARLIETFRAADFQASSSNVTRSEVLLSSSFEIGHAYEVTSRRIEYTPTDADAAPPIDESGQLIRPKFATVADPTLLDENGEPIPGRRTGGVLEVSLPRRLLRSGNLYYRWVLEYTSGGDRLTMRKSDIFRAGADREAPEAEDTRVSF